MREIQYATKESLVNMYLTNPNLSLQAVADQEECSAFGLRNKVIEFQTNDGVIKKTQIAGFR